MSSKESPSPQSPSVNAPAAGTPTNSTPVPPVSAPPAQTTTSQTAGNNANQGLPLHKPNDVWLPSFNALVGDWKGNPVDDIKRLFVKQVILDDQTTLDVETIKVPGFIGISDSLTVKDPAEKTVSGHADVAKFLERDGLYICTYQWNKDRYGVPFDTRKPLDQELFTEGFIKTKGTMLGRSSPPNDLTQRAI